MHSPEQHLPADLIDPRAAGERHRDLELFLHDLQDVRDALLAVRRYGMHPSAPSEAGVRAEREHAQHVEGTPSS